MKIFICWSGDRSRLAAEALREWLPYVVHTAHPWISTADIEPGSRWNAKIAEELESTEFGIICLTPDSINAPWVLFEAGALAKSLDKGLVVPYLIDIEPSSLVGPLVQFQSIKAEKEPTWGMILSICKNLKDTSLTRERLRTTYEKFWPDLEQALRRIPPDRRKKTPPERSDRSIMEEILETVRGLARAGSTREPAFLRESREKPLDETGFVSVDLSAVGKGYGNILFESCVDFQSFLDTLWTTYLKREFLPYRYGEDWVLEHKSTKETLSKSGRHDSRGMADVGIFPGSRLRLLKIGTLSSEETEQTSER